LGYGKEQIGELEKVINAVPCDVVVIGTPVDLRRVLRLNKPAVKVTYELEELTSPNLEQLLKRFLRELGKT
jgi:predicted GTPase